jgi:hypothetical protein
VEASQTHNYFPPVAQLLTYREPGMEKMEDWPDSLPSLKTFLADDSHDEWARVSVSSCLEKIGIYAPEARSACIINAGVLKE